MESPGFNGPSQSRPQHRRNASSKSKLLKSLVSPKPSASHARTQSSSALTSNHPNSAKAKVLGERQGNVQSPPSSPSKNRHRSLVYSPITRDHKNAKVTTQCQHGVRSSRKPEPSTNLPPMSSRTNHFSKDLTETGETDKENTAPLSSAPGSVETPIWAQFASTAKPEFKPSVGDGNPSNNLAEEIARYTPQEYSPSKQRNFHDQPGLRPTLDSRPQSMSCTASDTLAALGRRVSGKRLSIESRISEGVARRLSHEPGRRSSGDKSVIPHRHVEDRKGSWGSTEEDPSKEKLTVAKRGGRVMAAVAAIQGKPKQIHPEARPEMDPKAIDEAFEAVLDSRNIPEPQRQKMRSLTLRVKQDFIKQDQGLKTTSNSPVEAVTAGGAAADASAHSPPGQRQETDDSKSTKRSRGRTRAFTFSRGDKHGVDMSPSKKQRPQSKGRPTSLYIPKDATAKSPSATTPTSPFGSLGRKNPAPALPADYISYLKKHQDPTQAEVGRLHKLRILLRNETVAWVDSFVSLDGMTEIVGLLYRTMAVEWREEHEDQLLHETLLCLKGLCTTERAMLELDKVADKLFPALLGMLFDDERKGPAEYTTRTIIINVLFSFLASATSSSASELERRALRILTYLGEPPKAECERPVDFVLNMHTPRPYKLWGREVSNVTKEVFWIFLHHLNVVALAKNKTGNGSTANLAGEDEHQKIQEATYARRHFPGTRPPVPAAPYVGGVEWDATIYLAAHLDLLNGLIASLATAPARNSLRAELQISGFEKTMGATLRTCKEKFYAGIHDGLRAWVAAASEDGWDTRFVREGPTDEERAERARSQSPKKSPKKKNGDGPPKLEEVKLDARLPQLDLKLEGEVKQGEKRGGNDFDEHDGDEAWLG